MSPNILFIIYLVIAIPLFIIRKYYAGIAPLSPLNELIPLWIGNFIGISIIPIVLLIIYNIKKANKYIKIANYVVITIWILIFVFSTLQTLQDVFNNNHGFEQAVNVINSPRPFTVVLPIYWFSSLHLLVTLELNL